MKPSSIKIKLALVEDHTIVRTALGKMLNEIEQFQVVLETSNGQEFLDLYKEHSIDVVLLDLEMPVLNGIQVIRALRLAGSELKIIVLTTYSDVEMAFDILSEGADAYLLKECSTNQMIEAIQSIFNGEKYSNHFMNEVVLRFVKRSKRVERVKGNLDLSDRDLNVLRWICDGLTSKNIGEKIFRSKKNVDLIRTKLMKKFNVKSANELIREAIMLGLYEPRTNAEIELESKDLVQAKRLKRDRENFNPKN